MNIKAKKTRSGRHRRSASSVKPSKRSVNYHDLYNPFPSMEVFSIDQVAEIHETSLRTLEELGMKVLLPEAIEI